MSLRDQVTRVFARPKVRPPREAMNDAARTPAQARADAEKTLQLRELADKRDAQTAEARASIAREHAVPHLRPGWAAGTKTPAMIEAAAQKEADRMQAEGLAGIEGKTEAQLLSDADQRQAREPVAAEQATGIEADLSPEAASPDPGPSSADTAGEAWLHRESPSLSPEERTARIAAEHEASAQEHGSELDPGREIT